MYGVPALLIFLLFAGIALLFSVALVSQWRRSLRFPGGRSKLIVSTLFILLWVSLIAHLYVRKAHFHYTLWKLDASDVYSIQIGKHDFRDKESIQDLVSALRNSRWFEVNHGGWGDSIPLILRRHSGKEIALDVALYFRESGAVIGPANLNGLGSSATQAFAPELPRALEKHGVKLPDCDTPHGRPCRPDQLSP